MVCDPSPVMEQVQAKKKPSLRARQKELRKKQMLEAARKLFIANGYSKTSIETIAQNAEVGVATVYTYFENKENLAANLIRSDINEIFWEVSRVSESLPDDPAEAVIKLIDVLVNFHKFITAELLREFVSEARINGPVSAGPEMLSALDCGAAGVLVPHVTSGTMARDIVSKCRFRGGHRGFSNSTRAGNYGRAGIWEYVDTCDAVTTVIAMIEDPEAIENIDEILAVDGLDAVFIGRGDLMVAYEAQSPMADELVNGTRKVVEAAKAAGKPVLTVTVGGKDTEMLKALGVTGFMIASDQGFMRQAAATTLAEIRGPGASDA